MWSSLLFTMDITGGSVPIRHLRRSCANWTFHEEIVCLKYYVFLQNNFEQRKISFNFPMHALLHVYYSFYYPLMDMASNRRRCWAFLRIVNIQQVWENSWDTYNEDLEIRIRKTTTTYFQFVHNISSSLVKIKLHTKNQSTSLLTSGDSYEEDLKFWIWKMTST